MPECDLPLRFGDLTPAFLAAYERFEPFGQGNPECVFLTTGLRLAASVRVLGERHLALQVEDPETRRRFRATAWTRRIDWAQRARTEAWVAGTRFDLAYRLRRNWHPEFGGWELEVVDLQVLTS